MVAEAVAVIVVILAVGAEVLHRRRVERFARLAFGPAGKPNAWARMAPLARALSLGALAWGLVTLLLLTPKTHRGEQLDKNELRHLLLVLDVSPSMRLQDAGPSATQSRLNRVSDLMGSFFERAREPMKISIVAVYNGAKPVVQETLDMEVVHNVLDDLPMHYAFQVGETKLFDGLEEAANMAQHWKPRDATLLLLSDGDTVPATGMPRMPASIGHVVVVGVGDSSKGGFVDGRHSRQDLSTLRQIAARLGGRYHNGNEHQIPTDMLRSITQRTEATAIEKLTRREYALLSCTVGATLLAVLPWLLSRFGTNWKPGPPARDPTMVRVSNVSEKKVSKAFGIERATAVISS